MRCVAALRQSQVVPPTTQEYFMGFFSNILEKLGIGSGSAATHSGSHRDTL